MQKRWMKIKRLRRTPGISNWSLAKLLYKPANSKFDVEFIRKRPTLFQAHYQRNADFMCAEKAH